MNRTRLNRRLARTVVTICALLTALPVLLSCTAYVGEPRDQPPTATAPDDPKTSGPSSDHDLAVEEQLDQIASDVEQATDGEDLPGYAGLQIDVDSQTVDLYWVGDPPAYVHRIAANPPSGTTVNLRPATYDLQAMMAAVERVMVKYGDDIHAGSPTTEGTGITIEWTAGSAKNGPTREQLATTAGMPVSTEISEPAEPGLSLERCKWLNRPEGQEESR